MQRFQKTEIFGLDLWKYKVGSAISRTGERVRNNLQRNSTWPVTIAPIVILRVVRPVNSDAWHFIEFSLGDLCTRKPGFLLSSKNVFLFVPRRDRLTCGERSGNNNKGDRNRRRKQPVIWRTRCSHYFPLRSSILILVVFASYEGKDVTAGDVTHTRKKNTATGNVFFCRQVCTRFLGVHLNFHFLPLVLEPGCLKTRGGCIIIVRLYYSKSFTNNGHQEMRQHCAKPLRICTATLRKWGKCEHVLLYKEATQPNRCKCMP